MVAAHSSPSSGQNILQTVLAAAFAESPHRAPRPEQADFFFLPVPVGATLISGLHANE